MFSLVTALVSPHTIEALRGKKDTLVSTLTENANVLCFQPNDSICLLQGEWENVKKAYAILEEFYFRAQAEVMVREMLKGNYQQMEPTSPPSHFPKKERGLESADWSSSLLSSILPFVGEKSGNLSMKGSGNDKTRMRYNPDFLNMQDNSNSKLPGSGKEFAVRDELCGRRPDAEHADTTTIGDGQNGGHGEDPALEDDDEDDEDPPILLKEGPCGVDVISLSSEISDPKEMDFCDGSHLFSEGNASVSSYERMLKGLCGNLENAEEFSVNNERKHKAAKFGKLSGDDSEREPPELTEHNSFEAFVSEYGERKNLGLSRSAVCTLKSAERLTSALTSASSSLVVSQEMNAAFHTQQYLTDRLLTGCKLPQLSSLLLGGAALPQTIPTWQHYAGDLYSLHLSALQRSMQIKQEPSSLISSTDLAPIPDEFKTDLGYRFDEDAALQEMRCTHCGKTYRSEARMKEHIRTHEKDYVPVLHSCPKCGKSFTYRHNMVVHLRRFHYGWQPAKRHVCRVCGIRFQKPYLLRLHEHKAHLMPA